MVERKSVTKKPSWLSGIVLPCLVGLPFGSFVASRSAAWHSLAGWQALCGVAMIFERAPAYGKTSNPQGRRLCELYGVQWLGMALLTSLAWHERHTSPSLLTRGVLAANLVATFGFSIAAGPTRLVNANDKEMKLVPINSLLVAWAAASFFWEFLAKQE